MATIKKAVAKKSSAPAKANKKKVKKASTTEICFVIMPFGGWFDDYYDTVYRPAIVAAGLEPHRADDLYRPSTIINDIWAYTQKAKLILADLSGKNPNVFYELGLAHALAKPAILIAESIEDVPFDLRALRVLEYNKNAPRWGEVLAEKITKSIREVTSAPLQSVLPAFLSVKSDARQKPVSENDIQLLELRQEIELLRNEISRSARGRKENQIDAQEAERLLRLYLARKMPDRMIVNRLSDMGAPASWVEEKILEARRKTRTTTAGSSRRKVA